MNPKKSLKEIANEIMKSSAKVIGVVFETRAKYIETREGKEGVRKVEEKMSELGYPLKFKDIKTFSFYPVGLADLVIVIAKEIFNWKEKDIFDMGNNAPKYSFIHRLLSKYFLDLKRVVKEIPGYWRKYYTEGELEYELHEKEKYAIVYLKYKVTHPLICIYFGGYFLRIAQFMLKTPISIQETKCMFKGAPHHEFLLRWE